jgi:hypothetical protein
MADESLGTFEERKLLGKELRELLRFHGIEPHTIINDTTTRLSITLKGPNAQRLLDLLRRTPLAPGQDPVDERPEGQPVVTTFTPESEG